MRALANILRLGLKEGRSLAADPVLLGLMIYVFTFAVYTVARGMTFEVQRAAIAVVDEDDTPLSRRLIAGIQPPYFLEPVAISAIDIDTAMNTGRFVFVLEIPPGFERDVKRGRAPQVQIDVDATAMTQAGNGAAYLQQIFSAEMAEWATPGRAPASPVNLVLRAAFNPNLQSSWFTAVMQVLNNVTMLTVILAGAALVREREQGTVEHLLVMPVRPVEIMLAKIWANAAVIVVVACASLLGIVEGVLGVPVAGSLALFAAGTFVYAISTAALGIALATFAPTMPQFGLLSLPVLITMNLLSGSSTPLESMPSWLQAVMQLSPSTHYVAFAQAVLYRGAGMETVWPALLAMLAAALVLLAAAALRFRGALVEGS